MPQKFNVDDLVTVADVGDILCGTLTIQFTLEDGSSLDSNIFTVESIDGQDMDSFVVQKQQLTSSVGDYSIVYRVSL